MISFGSRQNQEPEQHLGLALDFCGWLCSAALSPKGVLIGLDVSKPSTVRRIPGLPRWSAELSLGERRYFLKHATIIETWSDWKKRHFGRANFLMVLDELNEDIETPSQILKRLGLFQAANKILPAGSRRRRRG